MPFSDSDGAAVPFFNGRAFAPIYTGLVLAVVLLLAIGAGREWLGSDPPQPLAFREMYAGASSLGIRLSDKLTRLTGQRVRMTGFMAPPLKPTLTFFVLTDVPMAICPFCSSDADWPEDIVVVKVRQAVTAIPFDRPIWVEGILEVGTEVDEETGFVSLVRIRADAIGERTDAP
ncbi:MAG: hypothetical protein LIP77_01235 [Planctomycetes bacterium]|nr:hypothetical protein [Planctomycetota bacterium]